MGESSRRAELETLFGLRNVRASWLRQNLHFSAAHLTDPIARRDLCAISAGTLPFAAASAHDVALTRPALVQLEDAINVAQDDPRARGAPSTLLLRLSDGRQSFAAVELLPLGGRVGVKSVPGTKLKLKEGALFRRGRLMLTLDVFEIVGRAPQSANVWGEEYGARVAARLRDAGLRPADAVSFDVLAGEPVDNSAALTSLGGIANLPDEGQDEDEFWVQAMAAESTLMSDALAGASGNASTPGTTIAPASFAEQVGVAALLDVDDVPDIEVVDDDGDEVMQGGEQVQAAPVGQAGASEEWDIPSVPESPDSDLDEPAPVAKPAAGSRLRRRRRSSG